MTASRSRWLRLPDAKETVVVAGSLSKTYAMTGWRMGFVLGPGAGGGGINKLQSHTTSNPTSIAQKAAIEALRGPQESVGIMLAEYRRRRDYVIGRLREMPGVKAQEPQGAFYAYPNVSAAFATASPNSLQFSEKLLGRRARGGGSRRSVRNRRPHPHVLCDFDEGAGARSRPSAAVHRRAPVTLRPTN